MSGPARRGDGAGGVPGGEVIIDLVLPAEEYLRYYAGEAGVVVARARDGRTVQFPAHVLRRFVDHDGVRGTFRLRFDDARRFVRMERLTPPGNA